MSVLVSEFYCLNVFCTVSDKCDCHRARYPGLKSAAVSVNLHGKLSLYAIQFYMQFQRYSYSVKEDDHHHFCVHNGPCDPSHTLNYYFCKPPNYLGNRTIILYYNFVLNVNKYNPVFIDLFGHIFIYNNIGRLNNNNKKLCLSQALRDSAQNVAMVYLPFII